MLAGVAALEIAQRSGWSRDFMRDTMPFAELLTWHHLALWRSGAWCVPPGTIETPEQQLARAAAAIPPDDAAE
jgi:hypothetical protein